MLHPLYSSFKTMLHALITIPPQKQRSQGFTILTKTLQQNQNSSQERSRPCYQSTLQAKDFEIEFGGL